MTPATVYLALAAALTGVAMGGAAIVLTGVLVNGRFAEVTGFRALRLAQKLPVAALAFVPILFFTARLYPWATAGHAPPDGFPRLYFKVPFFAVRAFLSFAVMVGAIMALARWPQSRSAVASVGLLLYTVAVTIIATDWIRSVDPDFHSSIFGLLLLSSQLVSAFAALPLMQRSLLTDADRDLLGKLLFSAGLLWAYMHAMQFIVVWAGNIPVEAAWYLRRGDGAWGALAVFLFIGQGCATLALMSQTVRMSARWLTASAAVTLVVRFAEMLWLIGPR